MGKQWFNKNAISLYGLSVNNNVETKNRDEEMINSVFESEKKPFWFLGLQYR